jgi:alpha-1,2-mannosyltransferase
MSESTNPLIRAIDRVTRPPILTVFGMLQALAILFFAAGYLATRRPPAETGGKPGTGDFLAFFVGGTLVREGRGAALYDFSVQRAVHDSVLAEHREAFQPYRNPPGLAVALAPYTALGYVPSFFFFTLAMVLALMAATLVAAPALPWVRAVPWGGATAVLLVAGYLPVALTMFGGQNTVLTLFLVAGVYSGLRTHRATAAGVFLGLLTYKPQFAIVPGLLILARREWRAVAVAVSVGVAHYVIGAVVVGLAWPIELLRALAQQAPLEMADTGLQQFSLVTAVQALLPSPVGGAVALAVAVGIIVLVLRASRGISFDDPRFPALFGLVIAGDMAASPHLQYYDAGLLALVALLALETRLSTRAPGLGTRVMLALAYLSYPIYRLGDAIGVQPLVLVLIGMLVWTSRLTRGPALEPQGGA